jgi:hypothetical protein
VLAERADEQLVEDNVPASTLPQSPPAPPATVNLSADDVACLDLAYQLLIELGLRRRARLAKAALQGEVEVGQDAIEERT